MRSLTWLPTFALAAALALPYGAPAICSAVHADMASSGVPTQQEDCPTPHDAPGDRCDLATCATTLVGPLAGGEATTTYAAVVDTGITLTDVRVSANASPPPTPPPQV